MAKAQSATSSPATSSYPSPQTGRSRPTPLPCALGWLPYDLGISQQVRLQATPTGEHHIYKIETHIERLSGDVASWQRMNRKFLNVLRKRFLVWRTLSSVIRQEYRERVPSEFAPSTEGVEQPT